ncbi:MAG TPA: molybdopterin cofactor-binding domain-containing protein, partial [Acidobacteriota bacterium]|nr:molybdopterin cofactor-binding domain-containing protein [Acidobacteriota bacterium]
MSEKWTLSRRSFLQLGATAGGGLVFTIYFRNSVLKAQTSGSFVPSAFVRIDPDNTITLWAKNPDMGQDVKTSMPMIIAEELDADWSRVKIEQADLNTQAYGGQGSGGSDSIREDWDEMRKAGALARQILILAAAQKWKVVPEECKTEKSQVLHSASNNKIPYGGLVSDAVNIPAKEIKPVFKNPKDYKILGARIGGIDTPRIVRGEPLYGIDVRVPGMLYAVIAKCPVYGGK